jgi:flavodoxin
MGEPESMKYLVVYFSRSGKTGRVAEAIAQQLGCRALNGRKQKPDPSGADLLIVGSGNYGGTPHKAFYEFVDGLPQGTDLKAAIFATSGGLEPKCLGIMEEALKTKGYEVISRFDCRGQMMLLNRGHPNEEDLRNARAFAKELEVNV